MKDKVVVVTGGTSGIGQVAAEALAGQGARIVLVARDQGRADAALGRLRAAGPGLAHGVHLANLASIADTRRVAAQIAAAEPRIDVLINNAGALFNHRQLSPEGLEMTFAVNHMAYFVLTQGLRERLVATPGARVVSTASAAHQGARLDFDDLQSARNYRGFAVYGRSKLANILFTRELSRRLEGTGVTANCLHPGFVATRFGDRSGGLVQAIMPLAKLFAVTPQQGGDTIIYLASAPQVVTISGLYFYKRQAISPTREGQDDAAAARLWAESERLAGAV
ncbi:MAG: SDR family oxidoreductase [Caulobacteraceae bacterium]|nr:SDR family oxidoreductase [Caulobacteraceae bacterium]